MAKIFRRTKQKYQQGTDGALSNAFAQESRTDGEVFNGNTGTNDGDRNKLYAPNRPGGWTTADLGRLIKMTVTPPSGGSSGTTKHDNWVFPIIEIVTTNVIRLGGGCRFQDAGTGVNWRLMASMQFDASSANFPTDSVNGAGPVVGQYITLPQPALTADALLKLVPWQVIKWNSGTQLVLSDWTGLVTTFPVASESGLSWFLHDRQAYNYHDLFYIMTRFHLDMGWTVTGAQAQGTIQLPAGGGASITDGQLIRLWDGTQKLTFEWDSGGGITGGHISLAFTGGDTQATLAATLTTALNGQAGFKLSAINAGTGLVRVFATKTNNDTTAGGVNTTTGVPFYYGSNPNFTTDPNEPIVLAGPGTMNITATGLTGGQHQGQFRGKNNGPNITTGAGTNGFTWEDMVFFSEGENGGSNLNDPKRMWTRMVKFVHTDNRWCFDWGMFQSWSPEFANASTFNVGNGINPLRAPNPLSANPFAVDPAATPSSNTGGAWSASSGISNFKAGSYSDIAANSLGLYGGDLVAIDYALFGDKDEVHLFALIEGIGSQYISYGALKEINQNPQRFLVRAAVASGAGNKTINVGPINPQTVAVPYQVGDTIQIAGKTLVGTPPTGGERIETGTILSFGTGGPDNSDYTITIAGPFANAAGYAIGAILGEEAEPTFMYAGGHVATFASSNAFRVHNSALFSDATHLDYSGAGTTSGFAANDGLGTLGQNVLTDVDPNRRSGRWGIVPIVCRNSTQGEFRGRIRYYSLASSRVGLWQFIQDRSNNWYFLLPLVLRQIDFAKVAIGPMSQNLAKPY